MGQFLGERQHFADQTTDVLPQESMEKQGSRLHSGGKVVSSIGAIMESFPYLFRCYEKPAFPT